MRIMAIKRRGVVAVPGEYRYGTSIEKKTAEELRAAAERQPIIMLTKGHPADGMPSTSDVIGTVSQKWNEERQRVEGEFWFHEEKVPDSIRAKIVNNEPVAISPGFMVDEVSPDGVQRGIVYTHMAILTEEDPRCPLGTCGVNVRMDSKDGRSHNLRFDQKTELEPAPKETKAPEEPKKVVAEVTPVEAPKAQDKPAEQKPEVEIPKKEPVKPPETPLVPEVIIPVPASNGPHEEWETHGTVIKYVPRVYRTKEQT